MQGGYGQPTSGLNRAQNPYMPSSGVPAYSSTSPGYGQSGKGGMGQPMYQPRSMNKPAYGQAAYGQPGGLGATPPQFGPIAPNLPPQQSPGQPPASFGPFAPGTQPPVNKPGTTPITTDATGRQRYTPTPFNVAAGQWGQYGSPTDATQGDWGWNDQTRQFEINGTAFAPGALSPDDPGALSWVARHKPIWDAQRRAAGLGG